jgi:hypothetical protein
MAAVDDLDEVLEQFQLAQDGIVKGNPEPVKKLWSHQEDVSHARSGIGTSENTSFQLLGE